MASADAGFRRLRVFCIELLLLFGGLPESHELVILSLFVLARFENDRVQLLSHPTDCTVLFGQVRALVKLVGVRENLLRFFESDASLRICTERAALSLIEVNPHEYNSYTTLNKKMNSRLCFLGRDMRR